MKIDPQCVPCLLKRVLFETRLTNAPENKRTDAVKAACAMLAEAYTPQGSSAAIATRVHRVVYDALGDHDPYRDLKRRSTKEALSLVNTVEELISKSPNRIKSSLLCAAIGNMLDFGIEGAGTTPEALSTVFHALYKEGFGHDDYTALNSLLHKTRRLLFFTDNCGEHVFDKILCRELRQAYPNMKITLVVKGIPILSDATLQDASEINFADAVDAIMTTESYAVGIPADPLPARLAKALDDADLVIAKGMANYESFSEAPVRPIAFLLRTKCPPIAASMRLPQNISALKVYQ
jgi:damage-control phosphatase, subfamily I